LIPICESATTPLRLAVGCVTAIHLRRDEAEAEHLFSASRALIGAIMEIDNRESRSPDLLVAVGKSPSSLS
jgi:hypothetical protein